MHIFFSKTFFWHPDKLPKNYFRTPTHYLCFFRPAKNTIKLGNKQKILDGFSTQPWTDFQLKNPQILDGFSTLQHIYIYMYMYFGGMLPYFSVAKTWREFPKVVKKKPFLTEFQSWCDSESAVPRRGRSKRSRTQKHANEHKRARTQVCKRAQKSAKERKRALACKNCKQPGL